MVTHQRNRPFVRLLTLVICAGSYMLCLLASSCVSYWYMPLWLTFTRNKSVQEKEKVNMLHKAENLYFNVTIENQETKSNRPEKYYNLLCLWGFFSSCMYCNAKPNSETLPPRLCKKTLGSMRWPQYNLVQYLCLMDLVYNYCSTCSSCGRRNLLHETVVGAGLF